MGINIIKCTSTANTTPCNRMPEYIVLHYTAGVNSSAGKAKSIANYFAKPSTKASADFIVDQGTIVQYNPDPTKRYCWAVGGSKYTKPTTTEGGKFYGKAKNSNCVSIEMCSDKKSTKTLNATDKDWYLNDKVVNNALELTKYLMNLYNIPIEKVIMHHSVTGKICPNPWCVNEAALKGWYDFKKRLTGTTQSNTKEETIKNNNTEEGKFYRVFAGSFSSEINANARAKSIRQKGYQAIVKKVDNLYKVQVAACKTKQAADTIKKDMDKLKFPAIVAYL